MAATPRWVLRSLTRATPGPATETSSCADAVAAEREIIARAAELTFSEIIDLLHVRAAVDPPRWWTTWRDRRHAVVDFADEHWVADAVCRKRTTR